MRLRLLAPLFTLGLACAGSAAHAAVFVVGAFANSSSGGVAVNSVSLTTGEVFTVSADPNDLWNAGALPRFSDADGLMGDRFATAADDSGQPVGTQIGANFGLWTQNGLSAPFGALVGELGGVFKVLGTSFSGPAWGTGTLHLYYWDQNFGDNTGDISVTINSRVKSGGAPEPVSWALMITGFSMAGALMRRRRALAALT